MALQIGITGGIGSGKTTVCKIFETFGIPVYYADDRAKNLMVDNPELVKEIISVFGKEAYFGSGHLNKKYLSAVVFQDVHKLKALNAIVHPAVHTDAEKWHLDHSTYPYTLREAALLFESGGYKALDKVITVVAPQEMRIERVMKRDNSTREDVEARISKQWTDDIKISMSDFVIKNDLKSSLILQVKKIHMTLLTDNQ